MCGAGARPVDLSCLRAAAATPTEKAAPIEPEEVAAPAKKSWMEENWVLILVIVLSLIVAIVAMIAANPEALAWLKKEEAVIEEVVEKGKKAAKKLGKKAMKGKK